MPLISAVLLLGGESRRMGRDKALLPHPDGGLFWQRQLAVLESLQPTEILWSGPPRPGMPDTVRRVLDATPHAGPLGGIVACLEAMRTESLLVVAVDLGRITGELLNKLLELSTPACGTAAKIGTLYEPLAAVYPRAIQPLAEMHLAAGRFALQDLLHEAEKSGLMRSVIPADEEQAQLQNFNSPEDLA
jgi:molybdopterin-guanine dinucleotide biosynthesis protein A